MENQYIQTKYKSQWGCIVSLEQLGLGSAKLIPRYNEGGIV